MLIPLLLVSLFIGQTSLVAAPGDADTDTFVATSLS
jgi:hypothetical protein